MVKNVKITEGELEFVTYAYWQLTTQDLLSWKDDVPHNVIKLVLLLCWSSLKNTLDRQPDKSTINEELNALNLIKKFADFDDSVQYTLLKHACMLGGAC